MPVRAREAIKIALAMTLAYAVALSMDWDKPMWAGIVVAMVSLSTVGQSLSKGALRMAGTLLAAAFSLTLLARCRCAAICRNGAHARWRAD